MEYNNKPVINNNQFKSKLEAVGVNIEMPK